MSSLLPRKTLRATEAEFVAMDEAAELADISWNQWARDGLALYAAVATGKHPGLKPQKVISG